MAGPQGVWDAARWALHHPRERWRTMGGVRRRAQSCLPQTLHHGSQPGRHGRRPLVARGLNSTTCVKDKDCHRDFLHEALGALDFPSRNVCCGNIEKLIRWRITLRRLHKVGKTQKNLYHDTLLEATGSQRCVPQKRIKKLSGEKSVLLFARYQNIPWICSRTIARKMNLIL